MNCGMYCGVLRPASHVCKKSFFFKLTHLRRLERFFVVIILCCTFAWVSHTFLPSHIHQSPSSPPSDFHEPSTQSHIIPTPSVEKPFPRHFIRVFGFLGDHPNFFEDSRALWSQRYPEWGHIVVTPPEARALVKRHFGETLDQYDQSLPIQKCDIARYAALFQYGGVYMDADVTPGPSHLESILARHDNASVVVFEEAILSPEEAAEVAAVQRIRKGDAEDRQRIANYFFIAKPRDAFWKVLMKEVWHRLDVNRVLEDDYDVLYTTGPDVVTSVVHRFLYGTKNYHSYSLHIVVRPEDQKYFRHEARGSWRTK